MARPVRPAHALSVAAAALLAHVRCTHPQAHAPFAPPALAAASRPSPRLPSSACDAGSWSECASVAQTELGAVIARVTAAWNAVAAQLARDRDAHDVIAVSCRNDKLAQLTALRRLVDEHAATLQEALAAHDRPRVAHERTVLAAAAAHAAGVSDESQQCIGGAMARVGPLPVTLALAR